MAMKPSQAAAPVSAQHQSQSSDNDRSGGELRALDCNLASLCDHIQMEGFNSGVFSDVVVQAMGSTYHLHRLILSRSSYFRCSNLHKFIFFVVHLIEGLACLRNMDDLFFVCMIFPSN